MEVEIKEQHVKKFIVDALTLANHHQLNKNVKYKDEIKEPKLKFTFDMGSIKLITNLVKQIKLEFINVIDDKNVVCIMQECLGKSNTSILGKMLFVSRENKEYVFLLGSKTIEYTHEDDMLLNDIIKNILLYITSILFYIMSIDNRRSINEKKILAVLSIIDIKLIASDLYPIVL